MTAGALAGLALATHLRGTVIFAALLLAVAALTLLRRLPWRPALAAAGVAATTGGAGTLLNTWLAGSLYPGGSKDLSGLAVTRMTTADGQLRALAGAAGQLWYLFASTWGLAALGMVALLSAAWRARRVIGPREGGHPATSARASLALLTLAAVLLVVTAGIAYTSSAALPDEHRVGNYVYGRYLACVALPWMLAALAFLARARSRQHVAPRVKALAAAMGLTVLTGALAAWHAGDRLTRYAFIPFDFPEIIFLTRTGDRLDMVTATAVALALLAAMTAAAVRRGRAWLLLAALALPNAAFAAHLAPATPQAAAHDWLPNPPHGPVAIDNQVSWSIRVALMHRVWWTPLTRFTGAPPRTACSAVLTRGPAPAGWQAAGQGRDWALWTNPACAQPGKASR